MGLYQQGTLVQDGTADFAGNQVATEVGLIHALDDLNTQARKSDDSFVWIGLFEPSLAELSTVARIFDLPRLQIDDAANPNQRPKAEIGESDAFIVMKILSYFEPTSDVETGQISIFVGRHYVITVRFGPLGDISTLRSQLTDSPELLVHGPLAVAHAIMDTTVDGYLCVAEEIARDIEQVEESVFSPERTDDSQTIYGVKRENLEMRRAVQPLVSMSHAVVSGDVTNIPSALDAFFRDVSEHLLRVADQAESNDTLLMTLLMAYTSRQDLQQNSDMRRISAYVAIAAVPTMIAGIYGMNFDNMPELHWEFGYLVILVFMASVCLVMLRAFKKSGWL